MNQSINQYSCVSNALIYRQNRSTCRSHIGYL